MTVDREQLFGILSDHFWDGERALSDIDAAVDAILALPDPVADAARVEITDEMVKRACASFDDLTSIPFRKHQVRRALDAAVNGGKQEAEKPRYFVDPPMAGH